MNKKTEERLKNLNEVVSVLVNNGSEIEELEYCIDLKNFNKTTVLPALKEAEKKIALAHKKLKDLIRDFEENG